MIFRCLIAFSLIFQNSFATAETLGRSAEESPEAVPAKSKTQTETFSNRCPAVIAEMTKEDAESSFFGVWEGQKRKCSLNIADEKRSITATDLTDTLQGHYRDKMKPTTTPRECGLTSNGTYAVGKFYYNQARLEAGQTKLLQELGDLSKLVPNEKPFSGSTTVGLLPPESSKFFPQVQALESQIRKCPPPGQSHLNQMAEGMMEADAIVAHYNGLVRCEQQPRGCPTRSTQSVTAERKQVGEIVQQLKQQYPWMNKDTFKEALSRGKSKESLLPGSATDEQRREARLESFRNAILAQTREEQKSRTEQLKKYTEASDCLLQSKPKDGLDCSSSRVRSIINSTPPVNTGVASIPFASRHLDMHSCIHEGKIDQAEITRKSYLDAVGIGLAGVTGLISFAKGAVQIATAIRAGKTIKEAYKIQAVSEAGLAGKAIAGIDVASAGGTVAYDAAKCIAERNLALTQLSQPQSEFQCSENLQQVVSDLNNCEILANVVMTGLPYLGFAYGPLSRKLSETKASNAKSGSVDKITESYRTLENGDSTIAPRLEVGSGPQVGGGHQELSRLRSKGIQLEEAPYQNFIKSVRPTQAIRGYKTPTGKRSSFETFYNHPDFPAYEKRAREIGVDIVVDTTLSGTRVRGYFMPLEKTPFIGVNTETNWSTFIHEFHHAEFNHAVKTGNVDLARLAMTKPNEPIENLLSPEALKILGPKRSEQFAMLARRQLDSVSIDETLASMRQMEDLGWRVFTPKGAKYYGMVKEYGLGYQIEYLEKLGSARNAVQEESLATAYKEFAAAKRTAAMPTRVGATVGVVALSAAGVGAARAGTSDDSGSSNIDKILYNDKGDMIVVYKPNEKGEVRMATTAKGQ